MAITLIAIGDTQKGNLVDETNMYINRLKHYTSFELKIINLPAKHKTTDVAMLKEREGELLLGVLQNKDYVVLLDEKGKTYTSPELASKIENWQMRSSNIVLVIGGAFGFSEEVYTRANEQMALSKLTFTHQMVRLFAIEQIYRAFTIIKGEKYHH